MKGVVRDALAPYQALTAAFGAGIRQRMEVWRRSRVQDERLAALEAEIKELRRERMRLSGVLQENQALRRQLAYKARSEKKMVPCRVIARGEMTGWWRTLRVNRGTAAGIEPPMAVLSERGLVGRVLHTSFYTADILLISDASSRVSVRVLPSETVGILKGGAPELHRHDLPYLLLPLSSLKVDYMSVLDDVREGDEVVTSGLGGVFPPGLPVGVIKSIHKDSSGLYRRADIELAADFNRLDTLYVLQQAESEARQ